MHSKLENITKLYKETLSYISGSSENWTSFLITASINYKYNFAEQILIFSQRPEATACADIDTVIDQKNYYLGVMSKKE